MEKSAITAGAAITLKVALQKESGLPEDLTGITDAIFTVKEAVSDTEAVITKTQTFVSPPSGSMISVALVEADTINLLGVYVADVAVKIAGKWYNSKPMYIDLQPRISIPEV